MGGRGLASSGVERSLAFQREADLAAAVAQAAVSDLAMPFVLLLALWRSLQGRSRS